MPEKLPPITFTHDLDERFESRRDLARAATTGEQTRVFRGVYVDSGEWQSVDDHAKYLLRISAIVGTRRTRPVVSHWSAAALHGLPVLGAWPTAVHTTVSPASAGRSKNGVVVHRAKLAEEDVVEIGGVLMTSVARTIVDLATSERFVDAVVAADRALLVDKYRKRPPMTTRLELQSALDRLLPFRAFRRAQLVVDFGEDLSGSVLESTSRVCMFMIGCPKPLLQVSYWDYLGFIGDSDFTWPTEGSLGEADGRQKYFEPRFTAGRTAEEIFTAERERHNRFTALPRNVIRWGWKVGNSPPLLRAHLLNGGLRLGVEWK